MEKKKIIILGGGFAGIYAAKELENLTKKTADQYEISLVNKENYFTYQPMISEVIGGSIGLMDSVNSLRALLKRTNIYVRTLEKIDVKEKTITLAPNFNHKDLILPYDYLVIALGVVTDFRNSPGGLQEHALAFKNLSDAMSIRNQLIDVLETAALECDPELRKELLTFVVGGGGFSGVEAIAEIHDFMRKSIKKYPTLESMQVRSVLVHNKERLVYRELSPSLGEYAASILQKRGVEILFNKKLISATPNEAILDDGTKIRAKTILATVPADTNPVLEDFPCEKYRGRLVTEQNMQVKGYDHIWALGDCACIPSPYTKFCPPTAQFAVREGKLVARNIWAKIHEKKQKDFVFKTLGVMAALGHRKAIAELFDSIKLSGYFAWIVWRFVYWMKLPGFRRKVNVAISWILSLIFPKDAVQLEYKTIQGIQHFYYCKGDVIFEKGDVGDYLYVITEGSIEVLEQENGTERQITVLKKGEYFGELALLNQKKRIATVRCLEDCQLIGIRKKDFHLLSTNFTKLREDFLQTQESRIKEHGKKVSDVKDYLSPDNQEKAS